MVLLDEQLMECQQWVTAFRKISHTVTQTVCFKDLEKPGWLSIGDSPQEWQDSSPTRFEYKRPARKKDYCTPREYLELDPDVLLQKRIDHTEQEIQDLIWERDHAEEAEAEKG